ncbi:MAG: hypothetical protein ACI8P2_003781 [Candidatus Latescibacterota bacterium]|jgi:hypothetical protein
MFYRAVALYAKAQGGYKNGDKGETASQLTYEFPRENGLWTIELSGLNQRDNDLEVFGSG